MLDRPSWQSYVGEGVEILITSSCDSEEATSVVKTIGLSFSRDKRAIIRVGANG